MQNEILSSEFENQTPTFSPASPIPPTTAPKPKTSPLLLLVGIVFLATIFGSAGYYFGNQASITTSSQQNVSQEKASSENTTALQGLENSKADWKTYSNQEKGFSFQYPADWEEVQSDYPEVFLKISRDLPDDSVDVTCKPGFGGGGTDCYSEVWIEVTSAPKPNDSASPADFDETRSFGEGFTYENQEIVNVNGLDITLNYLREDAFHPMNSYVTIGDEILHFSAYAPTSKNCVGICPEYDESALVLEAAAQIKEIILTVRPLSDETANLKTYTDEQNRFSFKYPSNLILATSGDNYTIYVETPNYRPFINDSYKIDVTIIPNDLGIPKVLPPLLANTPEADFTANRDFVDVNGVVGIVTTYTENWAQYKKYAMYSPDWIVSFKGTGMDHSLLDQIVPTFSFK